MPDPSDAAGSLDESGPLAGVTVVVTRPLEQAPALVELLEQIGARVIVMPLIEIVDVADAADVTAAIDDLGPADWVVVASAYAAARVAAVVADCDVKLAAVGATTAASLPRTDLIAERQSAEGLVALFPDAPLGGGRVVVAQAVGGAATLTEGIAAKGWQVTRLDTHESRPVVPTTRQQFAVLQADAVVFTSGSQAVAWKLVFGTSTPPIVVAMGPQTARDAEREGLKIHSMATDHSLHGLVTALVGLFDPR